MPEYRVLRIDEQLYGCEELPAGQPVLCDVTLTDAAGAARILPYPDKGILTKPFLFSVGVEGLVIAAATVTAFYLGLNAGGAAAGQTMAFATLCLSRLFHGFSCKSQHPVLLTRHFWNNRALLGAFAIGALLLGLVLLVPALEPLFAVAPLSIGMVGAIVGLAFGSMVVIQLLKLLRR